MPDHEVELVTTLRAQRIDLLLGDRMLLARARGVAPDLVGQLFHVRRWIVGNPEVPEKLRLTALDQLEAILDHLSNFASPRDGEAEKMAFNVRPSVSVLQLDSKPPLQ